MSEPTIPGLLEFTVLAFTATQLELKVKNLSGTVLDKTLRIELCPPMSLVGDQISDAAKEAATNEDLDGIASLAGVVTSPAGWSVWAGSEASDSSAIILLFNDLDQKTGKDLNPATKFAAGAEFTIRMPVDPLANHADIEFPYHYQHGRTKDDPRFKGDLKLKPADPPKWTPDVTLTTDQKNPTAVKAGDAAQIFWSIKDCVSATLRGPLPGGNPELPLSTNLDEKYNIAEGSLEIRVISSMTYVLQAEVKPPTANESLQVVRTLSFDTANNKYLHLDLRPDKVLPYGLIEANWAAWGVKEVEIDVGSDTTRRIKLTQQTLGRFYEGAGVMRFSAPKNDKEVVELLSPPEKKQSETIRIVRWKKMDEPSIAGHLRGLAVIAPKIALLTFNGLWIAEVRNADPDPALTSLAFTLKTDLNKPIEWTALAAVDERFVVLRRTDPIPDLEVAPFKLDGTPDEIPPLNLPADIRNLVSTPRAVFDIVGFRGRAYIAIESPTGTVRRAFSVGFDGKAKKAEYRSEPLLEHLLGYRLLTFDDALFALNRASGLMFRFDLTKEGMLDQPTKAASAVTRSDGQQEKSMIATGLAVPVGNVLVVLSPKSVPSLAELEEFGLHNVLRHVTTKSAVDPNEQHDLVYNPQKNYWGRCGHDLEVKEGAVAAFRGGESPRLWVIQPNGELHTLAVGSETLFAHDYVLDFPTKPLPPYLNKSREFKIKPSGPVIFALDDKYRKAGISDFVGGLAKLISPPPQGGREFPVELKYNDTDPTPITVRFQVQMGGPALNYMLELTFSGHDLRSASSVFRRLGFDSEGRLYNHEVYGTRREHSTADPIQLPRFDELVMFVVVNTSGFTLRLDGELSHIFIPTNTSHRIPLKKTADFNIFFDPKEESSKSELRVNLNLALPPGIEASPGSQLQTKLIRLNTDKATKIDVKLVKTLKPGDAALNVGGKPITSMETISVYLCHLDYKR